MKSPKSWQIGVDNDVESPRAPLGVRSRRNPPGGLPCHVGPFSSVARGRPCREHALYRTAPRGVQASESHLAGRQKPRDARIELPDCRTVRHKTRFWRRLAVRLGDGLPHGRAGETQGSGGISSDDPAGGDGSRRGRYGAASGAGFRPRGRTGLVRQEHDADQRHLRQPFLHRGAIDRRRAGTGSARRGVAMRRLRSVSEGVSNRGLVAPYTLDARKCLNYWTIEAKEPIPREIREQLGDRFFGCDVCQDVCPYNANAPTSNEQAFQPATALTRSTWSRCSISTRRPSARGFAKRPSGGRSGPGC